MKSFNNASLPYITLVFIIPCKHIFLIVLVYCCAVIARRNLRAGFRWFPSIPISFPATKN